MENKLTEEQKVTPWEVSKTKINYNKLVYQFGSQYVTQQLLERWEKVTGYEMHCWMRRGIFFSHKRLEDILDAYEEKKEIYIYTGRGPSSESLHLGHLIPFLFVKYLQDALQCIVVIQLSDDEKYFFSKKPITLAECERLSRENAKDIIACGFDINKTFIFSNTEFFGGDLYRMSCIISKAYSGHQSKSIYGIDLERNIGEISWSPKQIAPAFSQSFPHLFGKSDALCLIPSAIDQSPYFRMACDFADTATEGIKYKKPCAIVSKFLPSLKEGGKMSSNDDHTIYLDMTFEQLQKIIKKNATSGCGGDGSMNDHRKYGGDLTIDVAYQYLQYFMHDDEELKKIAIDFASGKIGSSDTKTHMIKCVWNVISVHQTNKKNLDKKTLEEFFLVRKLDMNRVAREPFIRDCYKSFGSDFDMTFGALRPIN